MTPPSTSLCFGRRSTRGWARPIDRQDPAALVHDFRYWHKPAVGGRAEHVRSARVFQTSTCSAIAKASSTSMPRYLTVLSILVWPSRSWMALRLPVRW